MRALALLLTLLLGSCAPCPARLPSACLLPSALLPCAAVPHGTIVVATGYSWREPGHRLYGRLNCQGGLLDDTQVAADTRFYPLGTVLWIEGLGRRIVSDRGSAILGPRHLDIHFTSLRAMRAWGTRLVHIRVLERP